MTEKGFWSLVELQMMSKAYLLKRKKTRIYKKTKTYAQKISATRRQPAVFHFLLVWFSSGPSLPLFLFLHFFFISFSSFSTELICMPLKVFCWSLTDPFILLFCFIIFIFTFFSFYFPSCCMLVLCRKLLQIHLLPWSCRRFCVTVDIKICMNTGLPTFSDW